jgi:DNA repair protein RadC
MMRGLTFRAPAQEVKVCEYTMKKINLSAVNEPIQTLYTKGKSSMSDWQVLATVGRLPEDLARKIIAKAEHQLAQLPKWTLQDWMEFDGIGIVKASALLTAFELGRRRVKEDQPKRFKITSSLDVFQYMKPYLLDEVVEHFYILLLNRANQVQRLIHISTGGTSATVVDPKIIFKHALENLASGIILVHNHPSGQLKPSDHDTRLTRKLKDAGQLLEIPVLDHLIFTDIAYYSFADEGMM